MYQAHMEVKSRMRNVVTTVMKVLYQAASQKL